MADNSKPSNFYSGSQDPVEQYQGFWFRKSSLQGIETMRFEFEAHPNDIILVSPVKSGTTWIKSLAYTILTCKQYDLNDPSYPLNNKNPHELVPNIEMQLYGPHSIPNPMSLSPRVFHTHVPYQLLPESIKSSGCKIIYICRNPKDTFVSLWGMTINRSENKDVSASKEEPVHNFCRGFYHSGPFYEHVASYWREKTKPNVLCLTYEDLKADPLVCIRILSDLMGCWWVKEEEDLRKISDKCSFQSLSEMEVNKTGEIRLPGLRLRNNSFFREGKVGGWKNFLTPELNAEMDKMIEEKLSLVKDLGLQFKYELTDRDVDLDGQPKQA
ncbi:hypothetical protein SUGI_0716470 [Cryptomeria japonica]|uniref:cytosolic sulfotransferase 5-like n=1 Tax=Cryptomeria japonica TaxID=3369 RepID=UPI0024147F4B|nr:cytosolic sulfotransferase 5-like [Cryptomeria japonica]GLJ35645.1 hypothetical protein SUGI_0716470 [Cryptomeria japonica]